MIRLVDRSEELLEMVDKYFHPAPVVNGVSQCNWGIPYTGVGEKVIHFYEWSDTTRKPLYFFNMEAFEGYCRTSEIQFFPYERDVIMRMLYNPHIACKKGDNRLVICSSLAQLSHVLNNCGGFNIPLRSVGRIPPSY